MNKLCVTLININDTASIYTYILLLLNSNTKEKYREGINAINLKLQLIKNTSFP